MSLSSVVVSSPTLASHVSGRVSPSSSMNVTVTSNVFESVSTPSVTSIVIVHMPASSYVGVQENVPSAISDAFMGRSGEENVSMSPSGSVAVNVMSSVEPSTTM